MIMKLKYRCYEHPHSLAAGLIAELERTGVKTVSFDVFDTLIHRRVHPDAVIWSTSRWLKNRLEALGHSTVVDPLEARNRAYAQLIGKKAELGLDLDVCLDELVLPWIDECVGKEFEGNLILAEQLAMIECEYEQKSSFCNLEILSLVKKLKNRGIRLIYTSDMYLGAKYIDRILDECGYKGLFETGYVSGDFALLKRTGRLFDAVLKIEKLKPNRLFHIGDNHISDGERPAERGIAAFICDYKKMVRRQRRMEYDFLRMKVDSKWMGVLAAQYSEAGLADIGTPEEAYGRRVLGPIFMSFVHRVAERCKEEGIKRVYFVAREGYLLKQLFEKIAPIVFSNSVEQPKTHYLAISRLTTFLASTKNFSLREVTASLNNTPHYSVRTLLAPLNLENSFLLSLGQRCGIADIDTAFPPFFKEWPPFHRLIEDTLLNIEIQKSSYLVNDNLRRYLKEQDFFSESRIAIVDVGWSGQIQDNLFKAIMARSDCPQIFGFYLGTTLTAHWRKTPRNWMEWTHGDYSHMDWFGRSAFEFVQGIEAVVRSPHGTTIGYFDNGQSIQPIYKLETDTSRQTEAKDDPMIALFQNGMREFAVHYSQAANMFGFNAADTLPYARMMLNRMVRFPSSEEAKWFLKVNNVSDLGSSEIFALGQQHPVSLFKPKIMLRAMRQSFWPYGVVSIGRRSLSQIFFAAFISIRMIPKIGKNLSEGIVFNAPTSTIDRPANVSFLSGTPDSLYESIQTLQKTCLEIGRKQARIMALHSATSPLSLREALTAHLAYRLVRVVCLFSGRYIPYADDLSIKGFIMRDLTRYKLVSQVIRYLRQSR
jgi:predicted HAD superfamily hydrolase